MILSSALEIFIAEKVLEGREERTLKNYTSVIGYFISFSGNVELEQITRQSIKEFQGYLLEKPCEKTFSKAPSGNLSRTSVRTYMTHIRSFFNYLYMEEYMEHRVFERVKLPKDKKKEIEILTPDDLNKLWSYFRRNESGVRYKAFICLLLDSGIRRSEALQLRLSDVRLQQNEIHLRYTKNGNERIVPIGHLTKKELLRYIHQYRFLCTDGTDALFTGPDGHALTEAAVRSLFIRLSKRLEKRVYPHLLRHTFATYYLIEYKDIHALKQILGHGDIAMVNKYLQLANRMAVKGRSVMDQISKTRQLQGITPTTF